MSVCVCVCVCVCTCVCLCVDVCTCVCAYIMCVCLLSCLCLLNSLDTVGNMQMAINDQDYQSAFKSIALKFAKSHHHQRSHFACYSNSTAT